MLLLLAGCGLREPRPPGPTPAAVRAELARLLPSGVHDRQGWAQDIQAAFFALDIEPSRENLCSVIAVTEQESTFQVAPPVPGLAKIARAEIDRRAARLHVPQLLVRGALNLTSPTGKSYAERLKRVRTEQELSAIFDDFAGMVPLGRQLFGSLNPVRTGGPMQVSIAFAESRAGDYPYPIEGSVRDEVFSRRGGMYFGIAHLLGYPAHYDRSLYRYADFNAGWYASRNAAFQNAVVQASGIKLALDGDLVIHGSSRVGATERAVRALGKRLDIGEDQIRRTLLQGDSLAFEDSELYEKVFELAERHAGKPLPRALLPGIKLESPKITRNLTTAWFANRVDERRKRCLARGG
ncbi:DUF1615 domain-containing protein [Pseudomonas oligotrophica]|uniref:DUF1615 domain-containing protein n=1 Tax=Pseudomonas oligotrophica TaxID=2912055 RepID=UPI001F16CD7B|nr:DUF1615 domain-containing protein [Pseudomonas oligotrophica]MCF7200897.1 DUF1615 domain-containing protein [Pseudomonas oligotrophica]